jgi:hypothetical protein
MVRVNGTSWDGADDGTSDVIIGKWESTYVTGSGNVLRSSNTKAMDVCADDGGVVIATGTSARTVRQRLLLSAAHTGDLSLFAGQRHVKVTSDISGVTAHIAGGWDYLECSATATIGSVAASYHMLDLPTSAVIAASKVASCIKTGSNTLGGTHTGVAAVFHAEAPITGAFDAFLAVGSNTGYSTQSGGTPTIVGKLLVTNSAGATLGYITINSIAG